jgi:hypothetical protein
MQARAIASSSLVLFRGTGFTLGVEAGCGRHYASISVSDGLVDYEEYYELTPEQYQTFDDVAALPGCDALTCSKYAGGRPTFDNLEFAAQGSVSDLPDGPERPAEGGG